MTAIALALLPEAYRIFGALTGLPFLVIGCIAAWKQWEAPSSARIDRRSPRFARCRGPSFPGVMESAYRRQGYGVSAIGGGAADFEITKEGRTALVQLQALEGGPHGRRRALRASMP